MSHIMTSIMSHSAVFETAVTRAHFGSGFEARNLSLSDGSAVATVIEGLSISTIRFPGGTQTESYFDPANPNNVNPVNIFSGSTATNFERISNFMQFASANDLQAVIVIPTYRYFDKNAINNGYLTENAVADITRFVEDLLLGANGSAEIAAFEIGNEWFNSQMLFDAVRNPNGWTASEFGVLQGRIAEIVDAAITEAASNQTPDIWVQTGQNGDTDVDRSGADDNTEILAGLSDRALAAIDGVVDHFYQPTRGDTPLEVISQGWVSSARIARLAAAGWDVAGEDSLDIVTTEWNVRAARNAGATGDSANITGFERLPLFLGLFADMIASGVDAALAYTAQAIGANGGSGTLSEYGESILTPTGLLFDLMSRSLPGTALADPNGDGTLSSSEYVFRDANGTGAGVTYTYIGDARIVAYYASAINDTLTFSVDNFSTFILAGYAISATVIHVADGDNPLDADANGYTAELSYPELDGSVAGDGVLEFTLAPYEVIQITVDFGGLSGAAVALEALNISGTGTDDRLVGSENNNIIRGRDGNDSIYGGGGDDTLYGGPGSDVIRGGVGNDRIDGGGGADRLIGGDGNDTISAGLGDDYIDGGGGNDLIVSGDGNDTILSIGGGDTISAGAGFDLILVAGAGTNIAGGDGFDTLSLLYSDVGVNFRLNAGIVEFGGQLETVRFREIESFVGSPFDDRFTISQGYAEVNLGAGDDFFGLGQMACGRYSGGDGNDIFRSVSFLAVIDGGNGDDLIMVQHSGTVYGGEGNDTIECGLGGTLLARLGHDIIFDGAGATISGGAGDDLIHCGSLAETLIFGVNDGHDIVEEFNWEMDTIEFSKIAQSCLLDGLYTLTETLEGTTLTLDGGASILFVGADIGSVSHGLLDFI